MNYSTISACRICGGTELVSCLSLGEQYVSDFVEPGQERSGPKVPIELVYCSACTLVQQLHSAPPEYLYQRHYWYHSGTTATMRQALKEVADKATVLANLSAGDVVLDIGSNDGTLLRSYAQQGIVRVGVEPAENLWEEGGRGVDILIKDFWSRERYAGAQYSVEMPKAKVITACGCFYDLESPNQFIADVAKVLHPEGVFICQLMCLKQMLDLNDVSNLAHEHLEFYTLHCLDYLFTKHGLRILDVEEVPVNGSSYRITARLKSAASSTRNVATGPRCDDYFLRENWLAQSKGWAPMVREFGKRSSENRAALRAAVLGIRGLGKRVWVYGSSTKGNVMLQYWGLDSSLIDAAADVNPEKIGKVMVGSGIPIKSVEDFREAHPHYALLLPYTFLDEFCQREEAWRAGGGKFIVPFPSFKVV